MATTSKQANTITVYVENRKGEWIARSPEHPDIVGRYPIRGRLGDGSGLEKALDQWRTKYVEDAKKSGFGGIATLKAALKKPALKTRFISADMVEIVLSTGGGGD